MVPTARPSLVQSASTASFLLFFAFVVAAGAVVVVCHGDGALRDFAAIIIVVDFVESDSVKRVQAEVGDRRANR